MPSSRPFVLLFAAALALLVLAGPGPADAQAHAAAQPMWGHELARAEEAVEEAIFHNCFLAGTLVDTTTRGRVPVEEVQEGDHVAPPPGHEGCTNPRCGRVEQLFRNTTREVVTITAVTRPRARERRSAAAGGGGKESGGEDGEPPSASLSQTIRCTPGHPFFVEGRGWVFAGDLRLGDVFEAGGERVEVGAVGTRAEQAQTFNFEVACHHTYRVAGGEGQPSVLVHNRSPMSAARRARLNAKFGRSGNLHRDINLRGVQEQVRNNAGRAVEHARGLGLPRRYGKFGTAAHGEFERLNRLTNQRIHGTGFQIHTEQFRHAVWSGPLLPGATRRGAIGGRRALGTKGLDVVIHEGRTPVYGMDLKTGRGWSPRSLAEYQHRFAVPIEQIYRR